MRRTITTSSGFWVSKMTELAEKIVDADCPAPSESEWSTTQRWYIEKLFDYINELLHRTELRANYLLVSHSFTAAAYFSVVTFMTSDNSKIRSSIHFGSCCEVIWDHLHGFMGILTLAVLLPGLILLASVWSAIHTILPIILRADIRLNQTFIASKSSAQYIEFMRSVGPSAAYVDFVEEIHILSQILNIKTKRVNRSARFFSWAIISLAPCLIAYAVGLSM